ncbi:hypothetical protein D3C71_1652090 [compost metagenome]
MLDEIKEQGAAAARAGMTVWDSPFLRADAMPAHTGEAFHDWDEKVRAWEAGWHRASVERLATRSVVTAAWLRALHAAAQMGAQSQKLDLFCNHGNAGAAPKRGDVNRARQVPPEN